MGRLVRRSKLTLALVGALMMLILKYCGRTCRSYNATYTQVLREGLAASRMRFFLHHVRNGFPRNVTNEPASVFYSPAAVHCERGHKPAVSFNGCDYASVNWNRGG